MSRSKTNTTPSNEPKVPRPMNCFLAFRLEKQGQIVDMVPGANHRDISKLLAKWWKELSEEEKEPYRERARQAKIEHAKKYPNYRYQPQKRNGRKTRKYVRRPQDKFTSRYEKNNRIMELFYQDPQHFFSRSPSSDGQQLNLPEDQQENHTASTMNSTIDQSNVSTPEYVNDKDSKSAVTNNSSPQSYASSSCNSSNIGSPLQTPPVTDEKNILFASVNAGCLFANNNNILRPDDYVLTAETYPMTTAATVPSVMVPSQRDVSSCYENIYGMTAGFPEQQPQQLVMPMTTTTDRMINNPIATLASSFSSIDTSDVLFDQYSYSPIEASNEWTLQRTELSAATQPSFFAQPALMSTYFPANMTTCIDPRLLNADYDFSTTTFQ